MQSHFSIYGKAWWQILPILKDAKPNYHGNAEDKDATIVSIILLTQGAARGTATRSWFLERFAWCGGLALILKAPAQSGTLFIRLTGQPNIMHIVVTQINCSRIRIPLVLLILAIGIILKLSTSGHIKPTKKTHAATEQGLTSKLNSKWETRCLQSHQHPNQKQQPRHAQNSTHMPS